MPRALILGGTGLIGRATAERLLAAGWLVDVTGRDASHVPEELRRPGATFLIANRDNPGELSSAMGDGADLLVDCLCYTAADATSLLPLMRNATSTVMLSSKAVYVDDAGNHSNSLVAPRFSGPILESHATMDPGDGDYMTREGYGANKVAAEHVLFDSGLPVTVIRPSKVHGAGAMRPREWIFIKRALDARPALFLANRGAGVDHTSAAMNIAALIEVAAAAPGSRILNCADPEAPSALGISRAIATILDHEWEEILLDGDAVGTLGEHPWDATYPIVLDMTNAVNLGYEPVGTFEQTVSAEVEWLVSLVSAGARPVELPSGLDDAFFESLFDYATEDAYLAERS
jgi:nucleoside-diphosphate-sugar epimerase